MFHKVSTTFAFLRRNLLPKPSFVTAIFVDCADDVHSKMKDNFRSTGSFDVHSARSNDVRSELTNASVGPRVAWKQIATHAATLFTSRATVRRNVPLVMLQPVGLQRLFFRPLVGTSIGEISDNFLAVLLLSVLSARHDTSATVKEWIMCDGKIQ